MSRIGKIQVDIVGNLAPFTKATQDAEKQGVIFARAVKGAMTASVAGLGNVAAGAAQKILSIKTAVIAAAGAFGAYKIVGTLHAAAMEVDKIGKASQRLGLSVPTLSALRFAAGEANIEFETLAKMAGKASRELAEIVAKGQTEMKIGRVTVKLTDANGQLRSINQLLPVIARGLQTVGSQGEKLRLSEKIFGRAGGEAFVQFLEDSGDFVKNLAEQTERAGRLNNIFTESQFKAAKDLVDAAGRIKAAWLGIRVAIVTEVAPAMTKVLDGIAERMGELPFLIRSTWQAISQNARDDTPGAQAFTRLIERGVEVLKVSAVEIGKVLGTTLVETIVIAMRAAGPAIADTFRDALGPILNVIPGVNIERSMRGKLGVMREQLAQATALGERIRALQSNLDNNPYLDGIDRSRVEGELNSAQAEAARGTSVSRMLKEIQLQERMIANEDIERARGLANAFVDGFQAAGAQAEQMQAKITAALAKWDEAKEQIFDLAGKEGFVGPPSPTAGMSGDVRKRWGALGSLFQIPDMAKAIGAEAGKNFQTAWAGAMKFQEGVKGRIDDALKEAKEIRFELYPEEKAKADIERVKELKKLLDSVGHENALSETDVEKKIAAIMKKLKDLGDKSEETFAVKLENDIKNFSVSAGDAFADLVVDGEAAFDDLLKSWTKTLVSMATQHFLFAPLFNTLGAQAGTLFNGIPATSAHGNVITSGQIVPYARGGLTGIINDTVIFPMHGGKLGSVAEGGRAEYAVEPVRMSDGNLGVRASGGGTVVQVIDQRRSGAEPRVDQTTGPDGRQLVRVWIRDEINGMVQNGGLDRSFGSAFGGRRRPVGR